MTRRPLTLDDVKINHEFQIVAAPVWAYRKCEPIARLWRSLLAKLQRNANARFKAEADEYKAYRARIEAGEATELDRLVIRWSAPSKVKVRPPHVTWETHVCRECGMTFYGPARSLRCSERCEAVAERRRIKARIAKISTERAVARQGRKCAYCGGSLNAQRSTSKYCSTKCRLYAARKRKKQLPTGRG
jgi:hypothetical protein